MFVRHEPVSVVVEFDDAQRVPGDREVAEQERPADDLVADPERFDHRFSGREADGSLGDVDERLDRTQCFERRLGGTVEVSGNGN